MCAALLLTYCRRFLIIVSGGMFVAVYICVVVLPMKAMMQRSEPMMGTSTTRWVLPYADRRHRLRRRPDRAGGHGDRSAAQWESCRIYVGFHGDAILRLDPVRLPPLPPRPARGISVLPLGHGRGQRAVGAPALQAYLHDRPRGNPRISASPSCSSSCCRGYVIGSDKQHNFDQRSPISRYCSS